MAKNEEKEFPLTNRYNCAIYLNRIISSSEICMDRLKQYNEEGEQLLLKYMGREDIPEKIYSELLDKTSSVVNYILNLLGDAQKISISYFKFRKHVLTHPISEVSLIQLEDDEQKLLKEFNKIRNWQNHVPESLLIAEMEQVEAGNMEFPMDPVIIRKYKNVAYAYFKDMIDNNIAFYKDARKIIQAAKRDYKNVYGKSVTYNRVYVDKKLDFDKSIPTKKAAKAQGL